MKMTLARRLTLIPVAALSLMAVAFLAPAQDRQANAAEAAEAMDSRWQRPSDTEIRRRLTDEQYYVTQEEGTERPFKNDYWDNKEEGLYVDVVTGEPLFSSREKFKSGTGWPSFYQPIEPANIIEHQDRTLWMTRTEVRSKHANSHLGHVFDDGPQPTGLRYCINSASLRFVPTDKLESEGYGQYLGLFE